MNCSLNCIPEIVSLSALLRTWDEAVGGIRGAVEVDGAFLPIRFYFSHVALHGEGCND
jgi:hypothetical protein